MSRAYRAALPNSNIVVLEQDLHESELQNTAVVSALYEKTTDRDQHEVSLLKPPAIGFDNTPRQPDRLSFISDRLARMALICGGTGTDSTGPVHTTHRHPRGIPMHRM